MCLLARDADAEETYEQVKKYWYSFHDLTGRNILFVFAGKQTAENQPNSLLVHETESYRAMANPSIRFIGDEPPTVPYYMYPRFNYGTYQKNEIGVTHTCSITELKEYFGLTEKEIPSLVFVPTHHLAREKKVVIHFKQENLYRTVKTIIESIELPLRKLTEIQEDFTNIDQRLTKLKNDIKQVQSGTRIQNRFTKVKSYLDGIIHNTEDVVLKERLCNSINSKSVEDWHKFDHQTRAYLNQYIDLLKINPTLDDNCRDNVEKLAELESLKREVDSIYCEMRNRITVYYDELAKAIEEINEQARIVETVKNWRMNSMGTFLFVTANGHEKTAFKKRFISQDEDYVFGKTYYLGKFGRYNAAYIHIDEQGVTNPAATLLVGELIRVLKPVAVVMVGIAFGTNEKKQKIGDVLVSKRILPYDSQKLLESGTQYKEIPKDVGFQLLNAFNDFDNWEYYFDEVQKSEVFIGSVLTGSRLINNYEYRTQLLTDFKEHEPIGGEMEAYGIYSVCRLHGVTEWIIIKGICDWGYKKNNPNKEHDQEVAADAAVDFCYNVFNRNGVFNELAEKLKKNEQNRQLHNEFATINNGSVGKQNLFNIDTMNGNIRI